MPLRLGIAGFGRVALHSYTPALSAISDFEVSVIAERASAARALAARSFPRARLLSDAFEACRTEQVDAWLIALPPAQHFVTAQAALVHGAHVYVEKPMTLQLADAERLVEIGRSSGRVAMVGYVGRFARPYVELKRRLAGLPLPGGVRVQTRLTFDEAKLPTWKRAPATGGGAIRDIAIHHADLVRFLFDTEIVQVRARVAARRVAVDSVEVELRLGNSVTVAGFFSSAARACDSVTVTHGALRLHAQRARYRSPLLRLAHRAVRRLTGAAAPDPAFVACFASFAAAIRRGETAAQPGLEDGARGVAFVRAAERSIQLGEWAEV